MNLVRKSLKLLPFSHLCWVFMFRYVSVINPMRVYVGKTTGYLQYMCIVKRYMGVEMGMGLGMGQGFVCMKIEF